MIKQMLWGTLEAKWRTVMIAVFALVLMIGGAMMKAPFMGAILLTANFGTAIVLGYWFITKGPDGKLVGTARRVLDSVYSAVFGSFARKRVLDLVITALTIQLALVSGMNLAWQFAIFGVITSIVACFIPDYKRFFASESKLEEAPQAA